MNSENTLKIIRIEKIWSAVLGFVIVVTGICYIAAVAHLFFTGGDTPYSRERVGEYLAKVIAPSALTLVGIIVGGILAIAADRKDSLKKGSLDAIRTLKMTSRLFPLSDASAVARALIIRERNKRTLIAALSYALSGAVLTVAVILALTVPKHTIEGQNAWVVKSMIFVAPAAIITVALAFVSERLRLHSAKAELEIIKSERDPGVRCAAPRLEENGTKSVILLAVKCALPVLAVVFIVLGIFNGGMSDVWSKAAAICTECIGLG